MRWWARSSAWRPVLTAKPLLCPADPRSRRSDPGPRPVLKSGMIGVEHGPATAVDGHQQDAMAAGRVGGRPKRVPTPRPKAPRRFLAPSEVADQNLAGDRSKRPERHDRARMRDDTKAVLCGQALDSEVEGSAAAGPGEVIKERGGREGGASQPGGPRTEPGQADGSQRAESGQHGSRRAGRSLV